MTLNEYQQEAKKTALYPEAYRLLYPTLGLAGEAGELANKVKKILRDHGGNLNQAAREDLVAELGDVLWYVAQLATDLGVSLEEVAQGNLAKLRSRLERGKLGGSGDNR
ncbi:nucleoside triphosphate pyrophosphohydrolase family protein [Thermus antranikianii]|uniref:nucleoside triphosphate pyrophosphohydrolase family protein n=1 Tax=Thermus antranikianii TaxID=88190 RepID=UPI001C743132|nr:nucleoside triphosphate pyrophosphohydrolase family protein [Thermus antranikianii]QWK21648.1 MAG: nucleoside triphosphate pyrophosphohydrolase family protein [Thermus antranikianii]